MLPSALIGGLLGPGICEDSDVRTRWHLQCSAACSACATARTARMSSSWQVECLRVAVKRCGSSGMCMPVGNCSAHN